MRQGIGFLLLTTTVTLCASQNIKKSEITLALEKNIHRIEFSKLYFFTKELITLASDTAFQSKFRNKLRQHDNIIRRTIADQKEYYLTLHILYKKIAIENSYEKEYKNGKDFLLDLLIGKRELPFAVDEKLIIQQVDGRKRSLITGYDEGASDQSTFMFFYYNPLLYKHALLNNNLDDDWARTGIFLCNYLRENGNPIIIRAPIKNEIMNIINGKEIRHEFKEIMKKLEECDISSNLFD